MKVLLLEFAITDFEEMYVIIDNEKQRLHISSVSYNYNVTLDLKRDLEEQIVQETKYEERNFGDRVRNVISKVIKECNL